MESSERDRDERDFSASPRSLWNAEENGRHRGTGSKWRAGVVSFFIAVGTRFV